MLFVNYQNDGHTRLYLYTVTDFELFFGHKHDVLPRPKGAAIAVLNPV